MKSPPVKERCGALSSKNERLLYCDTRDSSVPSGIHDLRLKPSEQKPDPIWRGKYEPHYSSAHRSKIQLSLRAGAPCRQVTLRGGRACGRGVTMLGAVLSTLWSVAEA